MIALALAVVLAVTPTADPAEPKTWFVGDSIGTMMLFDSDTVVDAVAGRRLEQATVPPASAGDTIVFELGTNNLSEPSTWHHVDHLLDAVPDGVCVWWVTPAAFMTPQWGLAFAEHLRQRLSGTCGGVIEWHRLGNAALTYDTVHPTTLGAIYLSALLHQSLTSNPTITIQ
jgi:hypothetical protein